MATLNVSVVRRQAMLDNLCGQLNSGTIKIYTGSMPATPETAVSSQTLLGTLSVRVCELGDAVGRDGGQHHAGLVC